MLEILVDDGLEDFDEVGVAANSADRSRHFYRLQHHGALRERQRKIVRGVRGREGMSGRGREGGRKGRR